MKVIHITVDDEAAEAYYKAASLLGGYYKLDKGISDGLKDVVKKLEEIEKNKTPEERILESINNKPAYLSSYPGLFVSCYGGCCGGDI